MAGQPGEGDHGKRRVGIGLHWLVMSPGGGCHSANGLDTTIGVPRLFLEKSSISMAPRPVSNLRVAGSCRGQMWLEEYRVALAPWGKSIAVRCCMAAGTDGVRAGRTGVDPARPSFVTRLRPASSSKDNRAASQAPKRSCRRRRGLWTDRLRTSPCHPLA